MGIKLARFGILAKETNPSPASLSLYYNQRSFIATVATPSTVLAATVCGLATFTKRRSGDDQSYFFGEVADRHWQVATFGSWLSLSGEGSVRVWAYDAWMASSWALNICIVLLMLIFIIGSFLPADNRLRRPYTMRVEQPLQSDSTGLSFISYGDWGVASHSSYRLAKQMAAAAKLLDAKFVLSLGDNFYKQGVKSLEDPQWNLKFENVYDARPLMIPWWIALGDHDHCGNVSAQILYTKQSRWTLPAAYYSSNFTLPAGQVVQLIVTDSVGLEGGVANGMVRRFETFLDPQFAGFEAGQKQWQWLEQTLRESTADWVIVAGHRPVYSGGQRKRTAAEGLYSAALQVLFAKYKVDLYICGHDHTAQHLRNRHDRGTHYIVNGIGGYTLHEVQPVNQTLYLARNRFFGFMTHTITKTHMDCTFLDEFGRQQHRIRIHPQPRNFPTLSSTSR
eukprot:jgi/Chlat1/7743/Chrsp66S07219